MSGGGYGQQQWGGQTGGNMYGSPYGAMGKIGGGIGQPLTGMATTNPVSPMDRAFAPTPGMGGPSQWTPGTEPQGVMGHPNGNNPGAGLLQSGSPWGGQAGGNMGAQMPREMRAPQMDGLGGFDPRTGTMMGGGGMYGAMGKMGGSVNPLTGMATTNPIGMGGGGSPSSSYSDYMNRRNAWINELRGYVAKPITPYQPAPSQPAPYQPAPYQPAPYQPAPSQPNPFIPDPTVPPAPITGTAQTGYRQRLDLRNRFGPLNTSITPNPDEGFMQFLQRAGFPVGYYGHAAAMGAPSDPSKWMSHIAGWYD